VTLNLYIYISVVALCLLWLH